MPIPRAYRSVGIKMTVPGDVRINGKDGEAGTTDAGNLADLAKQHAKTDEDGESLRHITGMKAGILGELLTGHGHLAGTNGEIDEHLFENPVNVLRTTGTGKGGDRIPNAIDLGIRDHGVFPEGRFISESGTTPGDDLESVGLVREGHFLIGQCKDLIAERIKGRSALRATDGSARAEGDDAGGRGHRGTCGRFGDW